VVTVRRIRRLNEENLQEVVIVMEVPVELLRGRLNMIGIDRRTKEIEDAWRRARVATEGANGGGGDAVVEDLEKLLYELMVEPSDASSLMNPTKLWLTSSAA
jgi:hypothetical protein